MTISDKQRAVDAAVSGIEKAHGKGSIMRLGEDALLEPVEVIATGSLALDEALGTGGYPRGRIIEVFGPESSGKTTLTLHAIAEAQRAGGVCAFIDAEHAFDLRYARAIGIDLERLLVSQPDSGEQALDIVEMLVRSGAVDLVVVDSVAALVPRAEIEGDMGDAHMGLQARLMSQALRKLNGVVSRTNTTLIFIKDIGRTPWGQDFRRFRNPESRFRSARSKPTRVGSGRIAGPNAKGRGPSHATVRIGSGAAHLSR